MKYFVGPVQIGSHGGALTDADRSEQWTVDSIEVEESKA